jgi:hypothetical protein
MIFFYMPVIKWDILCYGIVHSSVYPSFWGYFSVFHTFFGPFLLRNLVYCFVVKSSSSHFGLSDSFLQELCPLNFKKIKNFSVFPIF